MTIRAKKSNLGSMAAGRKVQGRINVHVYNFPSFSDKAEAAMR